MIYIFGAYRLDTQRHVLRCTDQPIQLRRKVFQVLTYMLAHRERVIAKQELCEQIWPQQFISDAALESTIKAVRQAIGDSGQRQQLIQTIYGQGYRFIAVVEEHSDAAAGEQDREASTLGAVVTIPQPVFNAVSVLPMQATPVIPDGQRTVEAETAMEPAWWRDSAHEGEYKLVTVLCAALIEASKHEGRSRQLHDLYALAKPEMERYGGTLQPIMSEHVLAVFGAPVAQEDHAHRAVLAALGLRQRLRDGGVTPSTPPGDMLTVQMGLHTGPVTVHGVGESAAGLVAVVGETVRQAMLLQAEAAPGTILCSEATACLVQGAARLEAVDPPQIDGPPAPVLAYTVLGQRTQRLPHVVRQKRGWTPFVGRARELQTLYALLAQVQEGRGQVVGVLGEPGIGKSRLLLEFQQCLRGYPVTYLGADCFAHGQATPYLPILTLLRHYYGLTERLPAATVTAKLQVSLQAGSLVSATWAPYLLQLLGVPLNVNLLSTLSPQAVKARTIEALVQLALHGAQQRPLVLTVETLHWIDPSSEEVLAALVERLAGARILLLLTYRPGYRPPWIGQSYATQMALTRLSSQASRQVVQAIVRTTPMPTTVAQAILTRAEGNPLFLEELAMTLVEQGDVHQSAGVPYTIQPVLAARIDRLPPPEKRLLQAASVIGKDVAVSLLLAIAGISEAALEQGLAHLQALEFLYETTSLAGRTLTFKHALTREAAYHSLLRSTRQGHHQHIAQAIAERFPETAEAQPELLAYHYTEAGLSEPAIRYWQRAGQRAAERSAHREAIEHLTTGLELLTHLPDSSERTQHELALQIALGRSFMAMKGYGAPEVGQAYVRARALCQQLGAPLQLFSVLRGLWVFHYMRAEFQTAQELGEQCLSLAQHMQDPDLLLRAHQTLGTTLYSRGQFARARTHLEEGMCRYATVPRRPRIVRAVQDPGVTCMSLFSLQLWYLGYPDQALHHSTQARHRAHELSHPFSQAEALFFAGVVHILRRQVQPAQECLKAVLALSREQGFPHWVTLGTVLWGWTLVGQGRTAAGITQMRQGLDAWRATSGEAARPWLLSLLAEAHHAAEQREQGLTIVREALALVETRGEHQPQAELYRLQGELQLSCSIAHAAESEVCFHHALAIARQQQAKSWELRAAVSLSRLWLRQGKRDQARQLLAGIYGWFTEGFDTPNLREAETLLTELSASLA